MVSEGTQSVQAVIREAEQRLRAHHPWLAYQDALGILFFVGALGACAVIAGLYLDGYLYWWFAAGAMAVPISILHEMEHDLIHRLYFRGRDWLRHTCFFVIWWAKLHVNPWWRAPQHLYHHQRSGQEDDIEEKLLGIGLPFGPFRFLVALHPGVAFYLLIRLRRQIREASLGRTILMSAPTFLVMLVIWEAFFGYIRVRYGYAPSWDPALLLPPEGWPLARNLAVLWLFPNILRQTCLALASSYCHYYADIEEDNIFLQTQILRHWSLAPIQLFCFNFAATHALHHFVVEQPFYLRQAVAFTATDLVVAKGVRLNDFGVVPRNNRRWGSAVSSDRVPTASA